MRSAFVFLSSLEFLLEVISGDETQAAILAASSILDRGEVERNVDLRVSQWPIT